MLTPCRINRRCNKDTVVNGIPIKEGCLIAIPLYYLHFKEDCWTDPERFNPERLGLWIAHTDTHIRCLHTYTNALYLLFKFHHICYSMQANFIPSAAGSASPRSPPSTLVPSSLLGVDLEPVLACDWHLWRPKWHSLKCSASSELWRHQRLRWG